MKAAEPASAPALAAPAAPAIPQSAANAVPFASDRVVPETAAASAAADGPASDQPPQADVSLASKSASTQPVVRAEPMPPNAPVPVPTGAAAEPKTEAVSTAAPAVADVPVEALVSDDTGAAPASPAAAPAKPAVLAAPTIPQAAGSAPRETNPATAAPGPTPPASVQTPATAASSTPTAPAAAPQTAEAAAGAIQAVGPAAKVATAQETRPADKTAAATPRPAGAPVAAATAVQADVTATAVKAIHGVSAAAAAFVARLRGDAKTGAVEAATDAAQAVAAAPQTLGPSLAVVAAPAQPAATRPRVPVAKLGAEIAKAAAGGETKFDVRLDPVGLGSVDVSLTFSDDGDVRAHLSVERPETLDLLARDQKQIERTLRDAGFEARDGSVSLSMRQNGGDGERQAQQRAYQTPDQTRASAGRTGGESDAPTVPVADLYRPRRDALVDVRL